MKTKILGLQRSTVLLALVVLITAPSLAYAQSKQTTVTVGNTSANPVPVTGSVTVANPVLQVEVANLDPVRVSGPTPTYGYSGQTLFAQRSLDIPAGVVLTDLRISWRSGVNPCEILVKEIVPSGVGTALRAIDFLYPASGQPVELHWVSGIPSDGDLGVYVNGNCSIHTTWSGYTP